MEVLRVRDLDMGCFLVNVDHPVMTHALEDRLPRPRHLAGADVESLMDRLHQALTTATMSTIRRQCLAAPSLGLIWGMTMS